MEKNWAAPRCFAAPLMAKHWPILVCVAGLLAVPCYAAKPADRDGSTPAKAIRLKQRNVDKAVEEEFVWMMKLHNYTPLLAMRDAFAKAVRQFKTGMKKSASIDPGWGHSSEDYNGHLISHWWFMTPRGKRDVYFDTGTSINTPGEVVRQEPARGGYMIRMAGTLKLQ
jgi:hypothetical protein